MEDNKDQFVRNVTFDGNGMISVALSEQQIRDLIRFCAIGDSIMNVDTTFDLGEFYVTPITYRNLSLHKNGPRASYMNWPSNDPYSQRN